MCVPVPLSSTAALPAPPPPATISGEEVPAASEVALGEVVAMTITSTTIRRMRPMTSHTFTFSHHAFFFSLTAYMQRGVCTYSSTNPGYVRGLI